ncbi:MAG: FAD-dependent oxidoreductase [Anaerolineae bacterium]|nr:FAD-dependent oxidoreductase [Anaerolineae bacterium]
MTSTNGTPLRVLRVAVIGSGPSAFYAVERLLKESALAVEVDIFERLPTPFGLVRGGVAPDHAKIKSVTKVYDRIASDPRVHFYGNVTFGKDVTRADLAQFYHAVIFAVGAQTDRHMGIPGEQLPGSYAATEFVGWYNAHPDYRDLEFDLSQESAAVIGNGNVAMDVARILARTPEELLETDIADYAIEALRNSNLHTIYVLGRRGPAQAAFTNPEIKELGEMTDADVIVAPEEVELDELSKAALEGDRSAERNVEILTRYSQQQPSGKKRQIVFRFLVSPTEIIGTDHVEAIKIVHNDLYKTDDGSLRPRPNGREEVIPVGLVFRSIGYKGVALPGVPFDERAGVIPNREGRVIDPQTGSPVTGDYVVGWIKRGPSGIIGTNKPDSVETVERLIEDVAAHGLPDPAQPTRADVENFLDVHNVHYVTYQDWLTLDSMELKNGQAQGRPRLKYSRVNDMLDALAMHNSDLLEPAIDS